LNAEYFLFLNHLDLKQWARDMRGSILTLFT